jgi:hypothetical protein
LTENFRGFSGQAVHPVKVFVPYRREFRRCHTLPAPHSGTRRAGAPSRTAGATLWLRRSFGRPTKPDFRWIPVQLLYQSGNQRFVSPAPAHPDTIDSDVFHTEGAYSSLMTGRGPSSRRARLPSGTSGPPSTGSPHLDHWGVHWGPRRILRSLSRLADRRGRRRPSAPRPTRWWIDQSSDDQDGVESRETMRRIKSASGIEDVGDGVNSDPDKRRSVRIRREIPEGSCLCKPDRQIETSA